VEKFYITHCSAKKDPTLKESNIHVRPHRLYTATPTQRFMKKCDEHGVNWAIFSDRYGVWFSKDRHQWYEKDPSKITESEFNQLVENFDRSLEQFDEIWFYYNPGRFHKLYRKLIKNSKLKKRIKLFRHLDEISKYFSILTPCSITDKEVT
jgi:hypothetical protein